MKARGVGALFRDPAAMNVVQGPWGASPTPAHRGFRDLQVYATGGAGHEASPADGSTLAQQRQAGVERDYADLNASVLAERLHAPSGSHRRALVGGVAPDPPGAA